MTKIELMTRQGILFWGLINAAVLELITLWMRFGMQMESTRDTQLIGAMTFGVRIHHGYLGVILGLVAWTFLADKPASRNACYVAAIGLFVSDMVHHFFVLWPIVGSPQFDLFYF